MGIGAKGFGKRFGIIRLLGALGPFSFALVLMACGGSGSSLGPTTNQTITATAEAYVEQFYPLWFTYYQSQYATTNQLIGPDKISEVYQIVVAINVDTLYASTFVDLSAQPVVLTIPSTDTTYSVLTLDPFGNIFQTKIPAQTPGTYGLTGPGFNGTLPNGVTPVPLPFNFTLLIVRIDNFSPTGMDQSAEATAFRAALLLQTLPDYMTNPTGGATRVLPEAFFGVPFKTEADNLLTVSPIEFLQQLQVAVASSHTPPLSAQQKNVSDRFNRLFGDGTFTSSSREAAFFNGAQKGYQAILHNYLEEVGSTNWIHFTNIGAWGSDFLDRSSITEFIQCGNGIDTAAYYHTFLDNTATPLDGRSTNYVLTFPAGQIPEAERFWSVTAYTPESIELIANSSAKYAVASYTPGLVTNPDGSISIYLAQSLPSGAPMANWLPTPDGPFNIMLRVYGPEGSVADNTYVPPAVVVSP